MGTFSSPSTDAEVEAAYDDNASYETDNSTTKAAIFLEAVKILLRRCAQSTTVDGISARWDTQALRDELKHARKFVASRAAGGSVKHLDFSGLRD